MVKVFSEGNAKGTASRRKRRRTQSIEQCGEKKKFWEGVDCGTPVWQKEEQALDSYMVRKKTSLQSEKQASAAAAAASKPSESDNTQPKNFEDSVEFLKATIEQQQGRIRDFEKLLSSWAEQKEELVKLREKVRLVEETKTSKEPEQPQNCSTPYGGQTLAEEDEFPPDCTQLPTTQVFDGGGEGDSSDNSQQSPTTDQSNNKYNSSTSATKPGGKSSEFQEQKESYEARIAELESTKKLELERMSIEYEQRIQDLVAQHSSKVQQQSSQLLESSKKLKEQETEHNIALQKTQKEHRDEIKSLQALRTKEFEESHNVIRQAEERHEESLAELRAKEEKHLQQLKGQHESALCKIRLQERAKREKLERKHKRELQKACAKQAQGSRKPSRGASPKSDSENSKPSSQELQAQVNSLLERYDELEALTEQLESDRQSVVDRDGEIVELRKQIDTQDQKFQHMKEQREHFKKVAIRKNDLAKALQMKMDKLVVDNNEKSQQIKRLRSKEKENTSRQHLKFGETNARQHIEDIQSFSSQEVRWVDRKSQNTIKKMQSTRTSPRKRRTRIRIQSPDGADESTWV